ncbi:hypothetical protein HDU96_009054 [Phlyctochytrium bullatum]|nr:hypothetical protein HDU96_009054 [Phlyctochytrium bullatum]
MVFSLQNIVFRLKPTVAFVGIDFETFFGGSTRDFATPRDQYSYFKDLALFVGAA